MSVALPQDRAWNAFDNSYDRRAFERICAEFGLSPHTDWRQKKSANHGLGTMYNYWTNVGYHPMEGEYDSHSMSFTKQTTNEVMHIDYIAQGSEVDGIWAAFILDKSEGFTRPGVERLNDSIRTYVWALLSAQARTRTSILGRGTAFDAQKQFLANVDDAISSPVDLPTSISRYQDVLQYARSKVDFAFGCGLYMAPSDMNLRVGKIVGYNNEIIIATENQKLGINSDINTLPVPPLKGSFKTQPAPAQPAMVQPPALARGEVPHLLPKALERIRAHEDEKVALIVGGIALVTLWLWAR